MCTKEIWRDIIGYEGLYLISNLGIIKSVERTYYNPRWKVNAFLKERILKYSNNSGYNRVALYKEGKKKWFYVHVLVANTFLGIKYAEVNHIDGNRSNNCLSNLEYVNRRENVTHYNKYKKNLVGAYKRKKGYVSEICIEGKRIYLGFFKTEIEAHNAYIMALESYNQENKYA